MLFIIFVMTSCSTKSCLQVSPQSNDTASVYLKDSGKAPRYLRIPSSIDGYKITWIGRFDECDRLHKVRIPDGAASCGCFRYCHNLEWISIPSSVNSFSGDYDFVGCYKLRIIKFRGTLKQWGDLGVRWIKIGSNASEPITVKCTDGSTTLHVY